MAGLSDFFKRRALSPEEKRRWFGVVRRLADELRIPHDQFLPFGQELLETARDFLSKKDPGLSQATRERAPEQLLKLHKDATSALHTAHPFIAAFAASREKRRNAHTITGIRPPKRKIPVALPTNLATEIIGSPPKFSSSDPGVTDIIITRHNTQNANNRNNFRGIRWPRSA